jgi:hypothetical protein
VVLESLLGHRLVEAGKLTEAHRLDVAVRVLYPSLAEDGYGEVFDTEGRYGFADAAAGDALARGDQAGVRSKLASGATTGQMTAQLAGSGAAIGQGSPLDVEADHALMSELDARIIANKSNGYTVGLHSDGRAAVDGFLGACAPDVPSAGADRG